MSDRIAISVDHVHKDFVLPHQKTTSVKGAFMNMLGGKQRTKELQHALKNISFEVKKGEFFGIVGRNGSGKSTMLKILAGIYQPTQGSIITRGKLVPFIELGVGFNGELTGRENVYLNGAILGFSRKEIDAMYEDIVAFAELEKFMDQKLKNYSSGMQVRLAFSMATRSEADILLVDEVLAVGDADFQRKCYDYFRSLKRNKKTVVFVSHDMNAVREYCDRAIMIEKSEIIASGDVESVANKYTRMFIEQAKDHERPSADENRWGTGEVEYSSVLSSVTDESINLRLTATAKELVHDLNFGFSIKDATGQSILGTNSQIKKRKIGTLQQGKSLDIEWKIPNILKDGEYFVDVAAVNLDGKVWDQWENANVFNVFKEEPTPYIVGPEILLNIREEK